MDFDNIDFEGTNQTTTDGSNPTKESDNVQSLDGDSTPDITSTDNNDNPNGNTNTDNADKDKTSDKSTDSSTGELNVGDKLDVDGKIYTVAENGDIIDDKGNVFKKANEVKDWLSESDIDEENEDNQINISKIQNAIGISITDEKGKAIEFTNDVDGIKSYLDSVIELRSNEIQEAAINRLFAENPHVKPFIDYVRLTGSPRGFGEIPDRSGIVVDKENVSQQEAIVRMAASEFGNKSINDNYIKYLKDTGSLYDEAVNQLNALQEQDIAYRKDIEYRAEAARKQEEEAINKYWERVSNTISSKKIAGYKLPDSFIQEKDGQKVTRTPNDFYNYISQSVDVDEDGNPITAYQRDLAKETDEETLNKDLLSAWLTFTGGSYKDLVDMAIKDEQVRVLKIKSKEHKAAKSVKVIKANNDKADLNDILLD